MLPLGHCHHLPECSLHFSTHKNYPSSGCGCSSVVKCLPSIHKVLSLMPSTSKRKNKQWPLQTCLGWGCPPQYWRKMGSIVIQSIMTRQRQKRDRTRSNPGCKVRDLSSGEGSLKASQNPGFLCSSSPEASTQQHFCVPITPIQTFNTGYKAQSTFLGRCSTNMPFLFAPLSFCLRLPCVDVTGHLRLGNFGVLATLGFELILAR
jgi:hypothetical protein